MARQLQHVLRRAFGDENSLAALLEKNGDATPLEIERHLIELRPTGDLAGSVLENGRIERIPETALEAAVEPSELEHAIAVTARKRNLADELNLRLGQGSRLVGAQHVHAAEVMDCCKTLDDRALACHAQGAA